MLQDGSRLFKAPFYKSMNSLNQAIHAKVPAAGVEPTSAEPESDILSIELRRRDAKI